MNLVEQRLFVRNRTQTLIIFFSMTSLLMLIGFLFAGIPGALFSVVLVIFSFIFSPRLSPAILLKLYGAKKINVEYSPELYEMVNVLINKTNLKVVPEIYYIPSAIVNSFTLGNREDCKILLSGGLLMSLSARELFNVLAHEISHVQNNDLNVMALADVMARVTSVMSLTGIFLLIFTLPFMFAGDNVFPMTGLVLLTFAPNIMTLLQLALSRNREFIADQKAVELTGDPSGLASALEKIDSFERHWARQLLLPQYKLSEPSLLRTHPPSKERIRRLLELDQANQLHEFIDQPANLQEYLKSKAVHKKPRRRIHGLWY